MWFTNTLRRALDIIRRRDTVSEEEAQRIFASFLGSPLGQDLAAAGAPGLGAPVNLTPEQEAERDELRRNPPDPPQDFLPGAPEHERRAAFGTFLTGGTPQEAMEAAARARSERN
jgi:ABC-type glycerol-3-phosphate transport system substrate-binding protein